MAAGPVLTSRAWERPVRLAFSAYQRMDDYISKFIVTVSADGLAASTPVRSTLNGYGLSGFIPELADDFRGWQGIRYWRSLEDQLRIDATWHDGGHVALFFQVTPTADANWTVSVEFTLEAGEELRRLGEDIAAFVEG